MFAQFIQPMIQSHGYWLVFTIICLESAGLPLPGETALVTAAIYAGATGDLNIVALVMMAMAGAVVGDNIGFWVGRRFGLQALITYGPRVHLTAGRLKLGQFLFHRHGGKIVFFGRFVAVLRVFAALLAGANHYAWRSFLFFNAAGGVVWASLFGFGGYWFGDLIHTFAGPMAVALFVAVVGGALAMAYVARSQEARWIALAEVALPGPVEEEGAAGEGKSGKS